MAKSTLLHLGGYGALRRVRPSQQLAILRYHAICGSEGFQYADPQICIDPANFDRHVAYLARAYSIVRLDDAAAMLRSGAPLPANAVAITFDDGYADNLEAARILAKYNASATFYITAGCLAGERPFWPAELRYLVRALPGRQLSVSAGVVVVDLDLRDEYGRLHAVRILTKTFKSHPIAVREQLRERLRALAGQVRMPRVMLTWEEVREMRRLGMTIGSHTFTHPNLPNAGVDDARKELVTSKARLEHELDATVTMFSYPNGGADRYCTPEIKRLVQEAGFLAATTSRNAIAGAHSDLYALERVEVEERLADLVFALEVERFILKPAARPGEAS
jgi:peptidoglycan/xylan/chitin deacetylase (PgdA/CDA1 family)